MPSATTLGDLFGAVESGSTAPFLLHRNGQVRLSYGDAATRSARYANALTEMGVSAGDRVAVQVTKSVEALLLYLGCVRVGAIFLPMNPAYTADEVEHVVSDAEPHLQIDDAGLAALGERADACDGTFDDHRGEPTDLAALLYTSGTTGRPKAAMLSHRNLATNARALCEVWELGSTDVVLHALPLFHTHGLFVATNTTLATGIPMVFLERFDLDDVLEALPRCTVMMGVPTYYTRLLGDSRFNRELCSDIRLFISGSAPMLESTHAEVQSRTGHVVLERYGMTETSIITSNPSTGDRRVGSVGRPLADVEIRVVGEDGAELHPTEVGGIEVRGPNVFGGYWRRPEVTAAEFAADGFFRTGDLGRLDEDGYLQIVGRSKDLVISGGFNVYPKEIESVLDELDGVAESAVIGVPDADYGEAVVAVVVAEGAELDVELLRERARERLAGYKVPKRIVTVDELPRNTMGKVEKSVLRRRFGEDG